MLNGCIWKVSTYEVCKVPIESGENRYDACFARTVLQFLRARVIDV